MRSAFSLRDRLENAFRAAGLAGVHRGFHEVALGVFEGFLVVRSGMAVLGAGEVEADDRQPQLIARLDHRTSQRERRHPENLLAGPFVEHPQQLGEIGGEAARNIRMAQVMMP